MNKLLVLCLLIALASNSHSRAQAAPLPRSSPEAQSVSSAGIREFVQAADEQVDSMNSFMLVWTPYNVLYDAEYNVGFGSTK